MGHVEGSVIRLCCRQKGDSHLIEGSCKGREIWVFILGRGRPVMIVQPALLLQQKKRIHVDQLTENLPFSKRCDCQSMDAMIWMDVLQNGVVAKEASIFGQ
jgi:hypothetical protein